MPTPLISIVVNNFNYARFLAQSIESALAQTWPATEVIVVDDASTDGSAEVIRSFGSRVTAVLQDRNRGQGAAFNAGVAACRGEIVIFLDADDYLHPQAAAAVASAWRPGLSKVQYRLDLVDVDGRRIDVYPPPEVRFDDGDVVPRLLELGRYETSVTSGNAFARSALDRVMPIPEADFRISADGYLVTVVPFHGPVASIEERLGAYRLHGANAWAQGSTGLALRVRRSLDHDLAKYDALRGKAREAGLAPHPALGTLDTHHLSMRLASLVLDPASHPYPEDERAALARAGARASRAASLAPVWKGFLFVWFLTVGALPRSLATRAISWRFDPMSRPGSIAILLRFIRRVAAPRLAIPPPDTLAPGLPGEGPVPLIPAAGPAASVARNAMYLVLGQVATTVLAILLSAALGRFLGAQDFGVYFLIATMSTFAYVVVEWGQGLFVIREVARAPASAGLLLGSALALRVVGTLVVIVPTLAVAGALGYDVRTRWLALAFIAVNLPLVLAQGFGMVFRGWDLMARDAAVSVANKILTVAIAVPVLYLGEGLWGVLGAQGLAGLGALAVAAWLYRSIGAPRLRFTSEAARAIVIGGTPILAWSVTSAVQPYIDAVVLSRLSSAAAIGWYGAARTVMGTLIAPSTILASASYPSLSRSATTAGTLRTGLRSALRPLFWLGGLGGVGVYLFADLAIGVIYGAKGYGPAAMILKAFAPVLFLLFVDVLLAHALAANGRAKAFAGVKVVSIVISTGLSLYLVQAFQERSGNGGIGLVVAFGLSELVVFGSSIFLLPRGSLDAALLLDAGRAVLAAAATILLFWFLPIATSLAAIPLCIGVFSLLSVVLGLVTRRDLETFKALLAGLRPRDVPSQGP